MDLLIRHVEPLLYEYKVDIGFYGHNHAVQRHASVYQKEVKQYSRQVVNADGSISNVFEDPPATVHFVIGTGGAMFTMNAVEPRPAWNEAFFYEYGYAKVTAVDPTKLEWTWINSQTNEPMDSVVITQSSRGSSGSNSNDDLSDGAIAGIIIGVLFFLSMLSFAVYTYFSKAPEPFINTSPDHTDQSLMGTGIGLTTITSNSSNSDIVSNPMIRDNVEEEYSEAL